MLLSLAAVVVPLFLAATTRLPAQPWEWISGTYHGVHCCGRQFITVVGDHGIAIRSTDEGRHWQRLATHTDNNLWGVRFSDAEHGVAVGDSGTIVRTADAGATWMPVQAGGQSDLRRVVFPTPTIGYAVGLRGAMLKTIDGGLTWQQQNPMVTSDIFDVNFQNSDNGVAVGDSGLILRTTDGGMSWRKIASRTTLWIISVDFSDERHGLAVGANGVTLRTSDGGEHWAVVASGESKYGYFTGVKVFDSLHAVVSGFTATIGHAGYTDDGGLHWQLTDDPDNSGGIVFYWGLAFADDSVAFAVGQDGRIGRTEDRGRTWQVLAHSPVTSVVGRMAFGSAADGASAGMLIIGSRYLRTLDSGTTWLPRRVLQYANNLLDIQMIGENIGYLYDFRPHVLRTTDAGDSWKELPTTLTPPATNGFAFSYATAERGFMVCGNGYIYRTADSGNTWQGSFATMPAAGDTAQVRMIRSASPRVAYAAGTRKPHPNEQPRLVSLLFRTEDSGATWMPMNVNNAGGLLDVSYWPISVLDERTVQVGRSDGYIVRTVDGGQTWDSVRLEGAGTITDLKFFNARMGYLVTSYPGSIYRSDDGGAHWVREYPAGNQALDSAMNLVNITLLPDHRTILIGGTGVLLRKRLPQQIPAGVDVSPVGPVVGERTLAVSVAPTPASEHFTVHVSGMGAVADRTISVHIVDMQGREIHPPAPRLTAGAFGEYSIDVDCAALASGSYIVCVDAGNVSGCARVVVIRK
ncbi:MAG TPA: YCF48-related protein [Candidatus Kapabacteria bacterium]|nr:YCF48-related protein [Candidatus Kapabacteria bacterium]